MNATEAKYRFSEIMSAVSLLPDLHIEDKSVDELRELAKQMVKEGDETTWQLPNLTKGLSDERVKNALICQALRDENKANQAKLVTLLTTTAQISIQNFVESLSEQEFNSREHKPSQDDIEALAICICILWATGHGAGLLQLMGVVGSVCAQFDMPMPSLVALLLRPRSEGIEYFKKLDPLSLFSESDSDK